MIRKTSERLKILTISKYTFEKRPFIPSERMGKKETINILK